MGDMHSGGPDGKQRSRRETRSEYSDEDEGTSKLGPGSSRRVFSSLWLFVAALFCCSLGVSVVLGHFWAYAHGCSVLVGMNGLVA